MASPRVAVGILKAEQIGVCFNGRFEDSSGTSFSGEYTFTAEDAGKTFFPLDPSSSFTIHDVIIGIDFHWEQREEQTFSGELHIALDPDSGQIYAVNRVEVEEYLQSVISSEMRGTANPALLKAHAVISRSWVLAQMDRYPANPGTPISTSDSEGLLWYDKEDHTLFDVCADDHCQRYQGLTRDITPEARQAVADTYGQVLLCDGGLVDARFHKCCGGVLEQFEACWGDVHYDYLLPVRDDEQGLLTDLSEEHDAEEFILRAPESFCSNVSSEILSEVLNGYDRTTTDYYRWEVSYTSEELRRLLIKKLNKDFGRIQALTPLARGASGRIYRLEIRGEHGSVVVGKELEIRRVLSESHLYSSAFVVRTEGPSDYPTHFTLHGAGWGHGVGLCQIGAAVMGTRGYDYREILLHYYPNTLLTSIYGEEKQTN